jgi:hypothetical protein
VQVTTIAGEDGVSGDVDGYPGTSVINRPHGLCLSGDVIFLADYNNNKVKAFTKSLLISSLLSLIVSSPSLSDQNA